MTHSCPVPLSVAECFTAAHQAQPLIATCSAAVRDQVLHLLGQQLRENASAILEANTLDLESSRDLATSPTILAWLRLTHERLKMGGAWLERLLSAPDPLAVSHGMAGHMFPIPIGLVGLVYEGFPLMPLLTASLCLKTGNALIVRPSPETSYTNQALLDLIHTALAKANLPITTIQSLAPEVPLKEITAAPSGLNLLIPYGRPSFVWQVQQQTSGQTLPIAIGNNYLFWGASGQPELVLEMIYRSHQAEPDAVVAIEKVLVPPELNRSLLAWLWDSLGQQGFEIRLGTALKAEFGQFKIVDAEEWQGAYLKKIVAFEAVPNLEAGITWINQYGRGPVCAVASESYRECLTLSQRVRSPQIWLNRPPEFSRLETLSLGISAQAGLYRGLVGLGQLVSHQRLFFA
ncbi:aldehyde dehydrogenase family protein [Synechococcus sp. PCC 6312]|uniref:aldehyde dehydrogenase family protein n=1 Tax=Synechococcus sp. (strain ATCC 27167 / PCC 6312) TaxID=195253 RepID=UPI00029EFA5E|nr:aldehyde dehydrogenase family protein [Synechococcus sp. PCC 6312]AFY60702.1 gamma-glutamyl phosphate reductase [Synechococcus sp. PCC 6312]